VGLGLIMKIFCSCRIYGFGSGEWRAHCAHLRVVLTFVPAKVLVLPGFGPAADPLLFRRKWAKPCWPWCDPSGSLRGSPAPSALLRTGPAEHKLAEPALSPELVEGSKGSNKVCLLFAASDHRGQPEGVGKEKANFAMLWPRLLSKTLFKLSVPDNLLP
jgi:hypothetical protein